MGIGLGPFPLKLRGKGTMGVSAMSARAKPFCSRLLHTYLEFLILETGRVQDALALILKNFGR